VASAVLRAPRSGFELVGKDQPLADGLSRLENNAELVGKGGQDFFRPAGAQLGMDSRPQAGNDLLRWPLDPVAIAVAADPDRDQQWSQVVRLDGAALRSRSRQGSGGNDTPRGRRNLPLVRFARERDPIVGRGNPTSQGRRPDPDVLEVGDPVTGRKRRRQGFPQPPRREARRQPQLGQLRLAS